MKQQTLQEQYNLLKEGKGHQGKFIADAKRQFPNIVHNSSNYEDTIQRLKQYHILSEPTILTENKEIDFFKSFNSKMLKESFDIHSQVYPSPIEENIEKIQEMLLEEGKNEFLDFFRVEKKDRSKFDRYKFDGSDDIDSLEQDLKGYASGREGIEGYYKIASKSDNIDESTDINDPVLMKARASKDAFKRGDYDDDRPKYKKGFRVEKSDSKGELIKALQADRDQLLKDMEQEAEPEGGRVADKYGSALNKIDKKLANLRGESEWGPETNPYMGKDKIDRIASTLEGRHEPKFRGQVRESKGSLNENKAVESKPTKEIVDMETKAFDFKDLDNVDNIFGEEFLKGLQVEMDDPKNEEKTLSELKKIVAKNLAKDRLFYVKDGAFGIKGIGYVDNAPGLAASKSDQMEKVKLKESMGEDTDYARRRREEDDYYEDDTFTDYARRRREEDDYYEDDTFFEDDITNDKIVSMLRKSIEDDSAVKDQRSKERRNANVFVRENDDDGLEQAKSEAQRISKEEGVSQHVNKIGNIYKVEDWYDSDTTVASYENGRSLRESNLKGSVVTEASSKGTGSLTIEKRKDGKYYWQYKFKSGKKEDWPEGFNTKADAQKDFMYRSKYIIRENEYEGMDYEDELANREFGMDFDQLGPNEQQWVRDEMGESREYTQDDFENSHNTDGHPEDTEMPSWMKENKNKNKINKISLLDLLETSLPLGEKPKPKPKKEKKPTTDSKLAEIDKQGRIVTLESQIETLEQIIDSKNQRISLVAEDENLSELVDSKKIKEMQKEIKLLEKKKNGLEKLYEKLAGCAYEKKEIVDENEDEDNLDLE
jgi:hypothetical protein